jgi:hypothetical protein
MIKMLKALLGIGDSLSPLDQRVLDSVQAVLPEGLREKWRAQLDAVNKVQRLPEGVEVNLYRMKNGKPSNEKDQAIVGFPDEHHFATVSVSAGESNAALQAKIWLVKGFVFSVEYSGPTSYFEELLGLADEVPVIVSCELHAVPSS